nr:hypothetical protein [uncultured Sphaerochaeta sp.]
MREWLGIIISVLSVLLAFGTFYWRVRVDNRQQQEKQTALQAEFSKSVNERIAAMQKAHDSEIAQLRLDLQSRLEDLHGKVDERRRKDVQDLHNRVNALETTYLASVGDRLGKIEGKMDSMNNTLMLIQRHFIENQGGSQ